MHEKRYQIHKTDAISTFFISSTPKFALAGYNFVVLKMTVKAINQTNKMQLEHILLKYVPIFNWFGESCVMTSDFQLTEFSVKKRRLAYFSIFCSLVVVTIVLFLYPVVLVEKYVEGSHISQTLFYTAGMAMFATKLINISQMHLWLNLLPKLYKMIKDLERIASFKYKMDFHQFHMEFLQRTKTFIGMLSINIVAIIVAHCKSPRDAIVIFCDGINYLFSFILILHLCFYVLLFKSLTISYIDYIERKVTNDMPKTLNRLRKEIHFIKTNHFKLYEISTFLNAAFGWNFVVIFVKEFIEITIHMYWIFMRVECTNISNMICNFFFLFHLLILAFE